jgi:hypothetical protein
MPDGEVKIPGLLLDGSSAKLKEHHLRYLVVSADTAAGALDEP